MIVLRRVWCNGGRGAVRTFSGCRWLPSNAWGDGQVLKLKHGAENKWMDCITGLDLCCLMTNGLRKDIRCHV